MIVSRRGLLASAGACAASAYALSSRAGADTAQYLYDPLGRLIRVTLSDGTIIIYDYDALGNRTRQVRSDGSAFNQTIQITGSSPVNLRTLADQSGYTGLTNAAITFQLASGVTIIGPAGAPVGGVAIDTGLWPSATYTISLALQVSGKIFGGGGRGADATEDDPDATGHQGGDALYCREPMSVLVNAGGEIKSGGGGGGAGRGWSRDFPEGTAYNFGGGGGGGFPNGPGGASGGPGAAGATGTTSSGGAGGAGGTTSGRVCGAGGAGGAGGATGATGGNGSNGGAWSPVGPSAGGAAGYAIRKNGKTVTVTNNGTIAGAVG